MKVKKIALRLSLSVIASLMGLVLLESALRIYYQSHRGIPLHIVIDSPVLYGLNPEHPEINSQGLRDDEVAVPKPDETSRILVLGDSIAYGAEVAKEETFPNVLERKLQKHETSIEVVNSGVNGYTLYNEWQYYLTAGRAFQSDVVVLAFSLNDIVNPRLHWNYTRDAVKNIPDEAIPNHDYDVNHILPRMERLKKEKSSLINRWMLYKFIKDRIGSRSAQKDKSLVILDSGIPTFLTGEDNISIEVLLDMSSPEWIWLKDKIKRLKAAVERDGAIFVVVVFPLAYQLDDNYPSFPQELIAEYCDSLSVPCLDLTNSFRAHPKEALFLLEKKEKYDIWHLTKRGHALAAEELEKCLFEIPFPGK